jgi:hypothetical protein
MSTFDEIAGTDEEIELRGLWLSRLMFGWIVGLPEDRGYEEWLEAVFEPEGSA